MERHVKERLVGAVVLIAAAIILIPEMLSGTDPEHPAPSASTSSEAPLKTYTIDLSKSPAAQAASAAEQTVDNRAPPAETSAAAEPASPPQASPESGNAEVVSTQGASNPATAEVAPPEAKESKQPARAAEPVVTSTPAPAPVSERPASAAVSGGWAVQMGSFASRTTAERMVKDLRANGHDAFVMPVKSGAATLYRVRVGPMKDRQSAQQALGKLKATVPGAAIVPHP